MLTIRLTEASEGALGFQILESLEGCHVDLGYTVEHFPTCPTLTVSVELVDPDEGLRVHAVYDGKAKTDRIYVIPFEVIRSITVL